MRGALCVAVLLAIMVLGTATASASLTFFSGPTYAFGSASDTSPLALVTLRPDSPADLVAVDRLAPGSIMVRLGNGDGTFQSPVDYAVTGTVTALLVADVNKDGKNDVIVVDQQGFSMLLGNGDGTLKPAVRYTPPSNNQTRIGGFALGDFNGDGYLDVTFGECASGIPPQGPLVVWLNQGNGTFASGSTSATEFGGCPERIVTGSFHGSSHPDDVIDLEAGALATHLANGDGTLQGARAISGLDMNTGQEGALLAGGDLNGDGNLDFVWAGEGTASQGLLRMFPGNGNGSFGPPIATNLQPELASSLAVADFNRDGVDDLALAPSGVFWGGTEVLLGTPMGQFTTSNTEPLLPEPFSGTQVAAGDIDGDGYPDLVVAEQGAMSPYLNGSLVSFDTEDVYFDTVSQGGSSADQTMTISNAGDPPLHISSVEIVPIPEAPGNAPQDFTIDENGCSGQTLPSGGGQCHIGVRFTPTVLGERDAALQVNSNSPESPNFQVLVGIGGASPSNTAPLASVSASVPGASVVGTADMKRATVHGTTVNALLTCSGHAGAKCTVTLTMIVTETKKGATLIAVTAAKKRIGVTKRRLILGTKSLTLTAGQSETVHVKLNATGLRLLTRRHSLRAELIATQMSGTTSTIVSRRIVSFKTTRKP